jgi:hypothetical protein
LHELAPLQIVYLSAKLDCNNLNKYLLAALVIIVAVPLIVLVFSLPAWFLGGHKQISVVVVAAFLTFDGIMVAASALFGPLKPSYVGRSILVVSVEFIVSATAFLLAFRGYVGLPTGLVHAGTAVTVGLALMFAGVVSLLLLMIGAT